MTQDQLRKILEFRKTYGLQLIAMVRECECGKLFVAESGHQRFCTAICAENKQRQHKRNWWTTRGNAWRAKRSAAVLGHLPTFPNVLPTGDAPDNRPATPATTNPPGQS